MSARLTALFLAIAGCDNGTYLVVDVESGTPIVATSLVVNTTNAGQVAHNRFERGTGFATPQTFSLSLDGTRRGTAVVEVVAMGATGELARASNSTQIMPNGTANVTVTFMPTLPPGADMTTPPDMAVALDIAQPAPRWVIQNSNTPDNLFGVWGLGTIVYAVGGDDQGSRGTIASTINGGAMWSVKSDWKQNWNAVWGSSASELVVAGDFGAALKTTNGGLFWQPIDTQTSEPLAAISGGGDNVFSEDVYIVGGKSFATAGTIVYSSRGFRSPMGVATMGGLRALRGVAWVSADEVYATGFGGTLIRSTDRGSSWQPLQSPVQILLWKIWAHPTGGIFAVGANGMILHSAGSGAPFVVVKSGTAEGLNGVWGIGNDVFAVGGAGTILHSGDGGSTWTPEMSNAGQMLWSVWGDDARNIYAVGAGGIILRRQ